MSATSTQHGRSNKRVLVGIPDLFFASKLSGTARQLGITVEFASSREALLDGTKAGPDLVVADLDAAAVDAIGVARELHGAREANLPRMIAFGSHVHGARLASARAAGYDEVLTKGMLAARIPQILASL